MGRMITAEEQQLRYAETKRYAHALITIEQMFEKGKKRTCPKCGDTFLTRKDKRIHRKQTSGQCQRTVANGRYD